ncbi:MAG TPA: elongation factor P [Candidatus Saccharimonadales bacterium]|nr:elongation factor P [Candidatus Saccharimonadales bacterium]
MIGVTELRAGTVFEENGQLLQVLSYEHIKLGRGSANIKVKVKNLRSGSTTEKSFINGARVNNISVLKKELQFLYKDDMAAYFMDPLTFDQISVPLKVIDGDEYLKEGQNFTISFLNNEPLSVLFPPKMEFTIAETEPGVRGNSATNIYKDAILDNGMNVKVPLFVKIGDKIKVDTRTGSYSEKA